MMVVVEHAPAPDTTDHFLAHRRLLFVVAYDLLGSAADAEDAVQETWLRWSAADRSDVTDPRAYLVRIATNQALNKLRARKARPETYIGPWLPEPLVEADPAVAVADRDEQQQAISLALLVVLETLSPAERAVFVLREVFGLPHEEVAATLDRSPAAVRQLAHRAREHVQDRRPRFPAAREQQREVTQRFFEACATGDKAALVELLAPDVRLLTDGGGRARAARRVIEGADKVARFLIGVRSTTQARDIRPAVVNGDPGIVGCVAGRVQLVAVPEVVDGRIAALFFVLNPAKLGHVRPAEPVAPGIAAGPAVDSRRY